MPVSWERDLGEACVVDRGSPNVERSDLSLENAQEVISSFPVGEVHSPPPNNTSRCNVPSEVCRRRGFACQQHRSPVAPPLAQHEPGTWRIR